MIALVTCREVPDLTDDDRLLASALARRGVAARAVAWDDPAEDWGAHAAVVIRSSWDYHLRVAEFRGWLASLEERGVRVENPLAVLRWNLAKTYLRELGARGIATVPTRWLARGEAGSLRSILDEEGWDDAVVKPVISASSHRTWRTSRATAHAEEAALRRLLAEGDVMVQPFVPQILEGEWSLCFVRGSYSHAVRKSPARGDFRVQSEHGGTAVAAVPPAGLIDDAGRALAALPAPALYARIDGCDVDGRLLLMELEAIEPQFFFATHPPAADRFAELLT